ncbi:MAG: hypothetical protein VCB25_07965, partial [Myxococcota bacterium]
DRSRSESPVSRIRSRVRAGRDRLFVRRVDVTMIGASPEFADRVVILAYSVLYHSQWAAEQGDL